MAFETMRDCAPGAFMPRGGGGGFGGGFGDSFRGGFSSFSSSLFGRGRKTGTYLAIGAVVVVGTLKVVSYIKKKKRRERWNKVGKDVVVLHMFSRGRYCPNVSPFVLKLETYLKMAQIPYVVDYEEPMGAKGKSPWITFNGEELADSQLIIEKLGQKYKKDLSAHLSAEQKAVATAMRIMLEDHFLICYGIWRYVTDDCTALLDSMITPLIFKILKPTFKGKIMKMAYVQGIGRHCNKDIEDFGRKNLLALSSWLGDKPYFMGDKATEVDCTIFGMLAQIEWNSAGSPYLYMIKNDYKNLSAYCHRVKKNFWPDWNQCLNPPQP